MLKTFESIASLQQSAIMNLHSFGKIFSFINVEATNDGALDIKIV